MPASLVEEVSFRGSEESLALFSRGAADLAGFHLEGFDLRRFVQPGRDVLVRFATREQGLIVPHGNPKRLASLADVAKTHARFVNRQKGSGTRRLIDRLLQESEIEPEAIRGYGSEEYTHRAVAATVAAGGADAGFGVAAAAAELGLDFVPVLRERYWLALRERALESPAARRLLEALSGKPLARIGRGFVGYDLAGCGEVVKADPMRALGFLIAALSCAAAIAEEAQVAVAANFAVPARHLAEAFSAASGHKLALSNGSTGKFYAQIRSGAPFHLLLSADAETPQRLEAEKLAVEGSRFTYAVGRLVLWSPKSNSAGEAETRLRNQEFKRLAIANPKLAPYGAAAKETLEKLGLWHGGAAEARPGGEHRPDLPVRRERQCRRRSRRPVADRQERAALAGPAASACAAAPGRGAAHPRRGKRRGERLPGLPEKRAGARADPQLWLRMTI